MPEMTAELMAPCGMNCRLCYAYIREKKKCAGCNGDTVSKPNHCIKCSIKNCPEILAGESGYCYSCPRFPCRRLRQLDQRYRMKYYMSMLENLRYIMQNGMTAFLLLEEERWTCRACGEILCVHRPECPKCGAPVPAYRTEQSL